MAINGVATGMTSAGLEDLTYYHDDILESGGVLKPTQMIVQAKGSPDMSVNINGAGVAYITNSSWTENAVAQNRFWRVVYDASPVINLAVAANASGNPRYTSVFVRRNGNTPDATASNAFEFYTVDGTPAASPTAPATPSNALRLADILVANGASSITNSVIYDARTYVTHTSSKAGLLRNPVINGNFDIWQRTTSSNSSQATNNYVADYWIAYSGVAGTSYTTFSRQDGTGVTGSQYCCRVQRQSGQTATNNIHLAYGMETADAIKFRGSKVTFSFWARKGSNYSPTNSILRFTYHTGTGTDQNVISGFTGAVQVDNDINLTTTWAKYTFTTSAAIGNTINQLGWWFRMTPTGTASTNDYFEITNFKMNAGEFELPQASRTFGEELNLCKRWYEKSYDYDVAPGTSGANGAAFWIVSDNNTSKFVFTTSFFKVEKRVAASSSNTTLYDLVGNSGKLTTYNAAGANTNNVTPSGGVQNGGRNMFSVNHNGTIAGVLYQFVTDVSL